VSKTICNKIDKNFFGFLRCGEFTVRNASDFDVTVNLCISDVLFYDDYAVLKLKESKNLSRIRQVATHV
jgi:hypothetical protein